MPSPAPAPEPPVDLPPGGLVRVRGRGEFFVRDSGGEGPPVLLIHGWMFASDLNWWPVYAALERAGYRVLAMDVRGHGRGLRSSASFRLDECAADAAAVVKRLGCGPVTAVGYSMGGPIAQLMAREHRESVAGLVLCATAQEWQDAWQKILWNTMGLVRLWLGLFPTAAWKLLLAASRAPGDDQQREWTAAELSRGSARDIAEAGRELSRYDARPWIGELRDLPSAVVVTARDHSVAPRKQRALAKALDAETFEVKADHMAVATDPEHFRRALLKAVAAVARDAAAVRAA
jgi:pimeloyl-ACP methyl ester carboxylesterase